MLDQTGFDLWADEYDESVMESDEENSYPFAGYKQVMNRIYEEIMQREKPSVLDLGFGTGKLALKLYENGCRVSGMDFSSRMIELAQEKMPGAQLVQGEFSEGLPEILRNQTYDFITATYSLHHLTDEKKAVLLQELLLLLNEGGRILVGDVAFETRKELKECRRKSGEEWDEDEIYIVYDEIKEQLKGKCSFEKLSFCAGILTMEKES